MCECWVLLYGDGGMSFILHSSLSFFSSLSGPVVVVFLEGSVETYCLWEFNHVVWAFSISYFCAIIDVDKTGLPFNMKYVLLTFLIPRPHSCTRRVVWEHVHNHNFNYVSDLKEIWVQNYKHTVRPMATLHMYWTKLNLQTLPTCELGGAWEWG